jgi:hypothetical protein
MPKAKASAWRIGEPMRQLKTVLIAVFTMTALSGLSATNASAFHPLVLTQSGKELLVTGEAGLGVIRALSAGVAATIECHKVLAHGWVLNKSTLGNRIKISFHTHCEQTVGGTKSACTEPIVLKEMIGELGLVGNKVVGILLAPTSGAEFVKVTCGGNTTTVEGATIVEVPEINRFGVNQYNKQLTEGEAIFATEGKSENPKYTSIELLGVQMTKVELKVSGFFGGKAAVEGNEFNVSTQGSFEICTRAPANCP